jgi:hypothetical protein
VCVCIGCVCVCVWGVCVYGVCVCMGCVCVWGVCMCGICLRTQEWISPLFYLLMCRHGISRISFKCFIFLKTVFHSIFQCHFEVVKTEFLLPFLSFVLKSRVCCFKLNQHFRTWAISRVLSISCADVPLSVEGKGTWRIDFFVFYSQTDWNALRILLEKPYQFRGGWGTGSHWWSSVPGGISSLSKGALQGWGWVCVLCQRADRGPLLTLGCAEVLLGSGGFFKFHADSHIFLQMLPFDKTLQSHDRFLSSENRLHPDPCCQ